MGRFDSLIEGVFCLRETEGESKVMPLDEAIGKLVRPGMVIHYTREANASLAQLSRQFWGTQPSFTLICDLISYFAIIPIYGGLVEKIIGSNFSHTYPAPAAIGVIQKAFREDRLKIETWSLNTIMLRLKAAAWGLPFLPTRSLLGSTMAQDNREDFQEMADPFGSGDKVGLVRALVPHISFVHGLAADPYGNTILPTPTYDLWGARAATEGVIVTVEEVVSTQFIRRHSPLVRLPGYLVKAVCPVPFGAHPLGMLNPLAQEVNNYGEDFPFLGEFREAVESPGRISSWVQEWVLSVKDHQGYLAHLGPARLSHLRERAQPESWRDEFALLENEISTSPQFNDTEMMVVAAARKMAQICQDRDYRVLLSGVGASGLAGWIAYYYLKERGYLLELAMGGGQFGFAPRPGLPVLTNNANIVTAKLLTDVTDTYGYIVGGGNNRCLAALGAAQIDKYGNINSTRRGEMFLFGPGGGNDAGSTCREVVVVMGHYTDRLVERVQYITTPGSRVSTLVTTSGVLEKRDGELVLTGYYPRPGMDEEQLLQNIREKTGWALKMDSHPAAIPPPTLEELLPLRLLDPKGFFIGK